MCGAMEVPPVARITASARSSSRSAFVHLPAEHHRDAVQVDLPRQVVGQLDELPTPRRRPGQVELAAELSALLVQGHPVSPSAAATAALMPAAPPPTTITFRGRSVLPTMVRSSS